ncbi:FAD binding domain-containing protein [Ditylenchus destructor]|nr:FAD binding domain-containing protein [Ditylenchus destructor]
MKDLSKATRVAIVGGGPGGLILANVLQQKANFNVKIYERSASRDSKYWQQGAIFNLIKGSGVKAIKEIGLLESLKDHYCSKVDIVRIIDKNAKLVGEMSTVINENEDTISNNLPFSPAIDRFSLQNMLLDSLKPEIVEWNKNFQSLTQKGDKWRLEFKDGTFDVADLVVGADGAKSKVRPFVTNTKPIYSGVTMIDGMVDNAEVLNSSLKLLGKGGKMFTSGASKSIVTSSKGDGSFQFHLGFKADEHWHQSGVANFGDKEEMLAWFKREYAEWSDVWSQLVENAVMPLIPRPQYFVPLDQDRMPFTHNITLLGDAAHGMPPYGGQGVNMALMDGLKFGKILSDNQRYPTIELAIKEHEKKMKKRMKRSERFAKFATNINHSPYFIFMVRQLTIVCSKFEHKPPIFKAKRMTTELLEMETSDSECSNTASLSSNSIPPYSSSSFT